MSRSNPALILLHGGPGASESALFRHYNAALEQHFLVLYWEQRGTARSFHGDIPPESMTVAQFVRDLDEVVELVRQRFGKEKVVLLGHSWGTVLGTIYAFRYPEKVAAYVGVAPIADMEQGDRLSYEFARSEARQRGNANALSALETIGPPPYASVDDRLAVGTWLGAMIDMSPPCWPRHTSRPSKRPASDSYGSRSRCIIRRSRNPRNSMRC